MDRYEHLGTPQRTITPFFVLNGRLEFLGGDIFMRFCSYRDKPVVPEKRSRLDRLWFDVPIDQESINLFFEDRDIHQGRVPKQFREDCRVAMDEDVPHTDDVAPRYLAVLFLELLGKHIGGFSDDFHNLDDGEVT